MDLSQRGCDGNQVIRKIHCNKYVPSLTDYFFALLTVLDE